MERFFPKMKKELSEFSQLGSDDDVITAVVYFLALQNADFYKEGICMLYSRRAKCEKVAET